MSKKCAVCGGSAMGTCTCSWYPQKCSACGSCLKCGKYGFTIEEVLTNCETALKWADELTYKEMRE